MALQACIGIRAATAAYTFFLPPFLPFDMRLFLPTAMLGNRLAALPVLALQEADKSHSASLGRRGFWCEPATAFANASQTCVRSCTACTDGRDMQAVVLCFCVICHRRDLHGECSHCLGALHCTACRTAQNWCHEAHSVSCIELLKEA